MGNIVMKVDRDRDQYVIWSSVVDAPAFIGNRAETATELARDIPRGYAPAAGNSPEDRLARADETGTSAVYGEPPFDGAFDDSGMIVEQRGWLPRADFARFVDAVVADDMDAAYGVLQPFEDDQPESA